MKQPISIAETVGEKTKSIHSARDPDSRSPSPSNLLSFWSSLPLPAQRKALLLVFALTGFLFLVLALIFSYHVAAQTAFFSPLLGPLINYQAEFVMAIALLGVAVGAGVFYLSLGVLEHKQHDLRANTNLLLKFLSEDERTVVELLLSRRGSAYQSELSRLPDMSRIRAHRVVKKLMARGLVHASRAGRLNRLELAPEILEGLRQK